MTPIAPLADGAVRVRWIEVDAVASSHLAAWRRRLDEDEQARADRFRFASDRDVFIAAHALLRTVLSEATGVSHEQWRFSTGRNGKPELADRRLGARLRFNLSHTKGIAACAIAGEDIGIDVEAADRPVDLDIARSCLAPAEFLAVASASPERRAEVFFRFWTLKEAFIKATGDGLSRGLGTFSFALDPIRISLQRQNTAGCHESDHADWHFAEYRPCQDRPLALAIRRPGTGQIEIDAGPANGLVERSMTMA